VIEPRKMDIFSFVQAKLKIDDVEPMYTAITRCKLPLITRQRLCFAEGLADHLGLAARMAEAGNFWLGVKDFILQGQRGGARRHFRGAKALEALAVMERRFPHVSEFFMQMPSDFFKAREYIMSTPQFGPFSAFKLADMAERTCKTTVDFSDVGLRDFSKFPQRGAALAAEYLGTTVDVLYTKMLHYKWDTLAPPAFDRPLNAQELETMFCNYGHSKWHPPGYEGQELRKLLAGYGPLAERIRKELPC